MSNRNSEPYTVVSSKLPSSNCARNIIERATFTGIVKKCTNFGLNYEKSNTCYACTTNTS